MDNPVARINRFADVLALVPWSTRRMTLTLLGTLALLALVDSTSIGTLLLPIWFLLAPQGVRVGRYVLYLATLAVFYGLIGVGLLLGGRAWLGDLAARADSVPGARVMVVLGAAMLIGSFFMGKRQGPGRFVRWRDRAMGSADADGSTGVRPVIGLALVAGSIEVATMLPYLGATGLLATSDLSLPLQLATVAGYCVVMVLPAMVLLGLRLGARRVIEPALTRFAGWMERSAGETTAWVVGIIGFLIARNAWAQADLATWWSSLTG